MAQRGRPRKVQEETVTQEVPNAGQVEEAEIYFKSRFWHSVYCQDRHAKGFHSPTKHTRDVFNVPPPIRGDGKTFCDHCDTSMGEWLDVLDTVRESFRLQARRTNECEAKWQKAKSQD